MLFNDIIIVFSEVTVSAEAVASLTKVKPCFGLFAILYIFYFPNVLCKTYKIFFFHLFSLFHSKVNNSCVCLILSQQVNNSLVRGSYRRSNCSSIAAQHLLAYAASLRPQRTVISLFMILLIFFF